MDNQEQEYAKRNRAKLQEQIAQIEASGSDRQKEQLDALKKQLAEADKQMSQAESQQGKQQGKPVGASTTTNQPGVTRSGEGQDR